MTVIPDYTSTSYLTKARWSSIWQQLFLVEQSNPETVLEVGIGSGLLSSILRQKYVLTTLDSDISLNPSILSSCTEIPFEANTFDTVVAFQVLEHLPYSSSLLALAEMLRVSKRKVILSLPDRSIRWNSHLYIPMLGHLRISLAKPLLKRPFHVYDGERHWELDTKQIPLRRFLSDLATIATVETTFKCFDNPYHRFFVLRAK